MSWREWMCPHSELIAEPDDGPKGICVKCGAVVQRYLTREVLEQTFEAIKEQRWR